MWHVIILLGQIMCINTSCVIFCVIALYWRDSTALPGKEIIAAFNFFEDLHIFLIRISTKHKKVPRCHSYNENINFHSLAVQFIQTKSFPYFYHCFECTVYPNSSSDCGFFEQQDQLRKIYPIYFTKQPNTMETSSVLLYSTDNNFFLSLSISGEKRI